MEEATNTNSQIPKERSQPWMAVPEVQKLFNKTDDAATTKPTDHNPSEFNAECEDAQANPRSEINTAEANPTLRLNAMKGVFNSTSINIADVSL